MVVKGGEIGSVVVHHGDVIITDGAASAGAAQEFTSREGRHLRHEVGLRSRTRNEPDLSA
jgi:hypothetical protein